MVFREGRERERERESE
uniref:Uncharacterized protein n=1 Tax=Anguilla anguilla TaxID=7936 RepID=A0A0E9VVB2_ANGAN